MAKSLFIAEKPSVAKEFAKALKETDRPVWIDCHIAKDEFVLPMIPAGGTVEDMIIG
jgi:acetolactate synthase-1/2/3 large subunit